MEITTPSLTITHRSSVTEDQIDHLGHMNVRFYGVNAHAATQRLLTSLGVPAAGRRVVDVYTRHHREQLLGAELSVRSGVLEVLADGVRIYHELTNDETGALAATFVHRVRLDDPGAVVALAAAVDGETIEIPTAGRPRSIPLDTDPVASAPGLDQLRAQDLAIRRVRAITAEECDEHGDYLPTMAALLVWAGEPAHQRFPEMLHEGTDGERMGWASMETRIVMARLPRVGDRIQSFSAVVAVGDKVMQNIMWSYDVDRAELLTTFEIVNLAFNVEARRPMVIPDAIRQSEGLILHPELAPTRAARTDDEG